MVRDWPIMTIAECAASEPYSTQIGPFGEKIRAESYTASGSPVLRGTNVNTDARFHDEDFVFIDSEVAKNEFDKFVCEAGDVILCHKGTLGKIGIIPEKNRFGKYIMGNSMMKVRCDRSKLEPLYLYYWLCSRSGQDYLFSRVSQVGVPQIQRPLTTLREAELPVPPLSEQKAISLVLGKLDDKIEFNRRMNSTLEAMARALFQRWFVDFEPVRAKREGRIPIGLDKETAGLFPAELQESSLGEVPKGWEVSALSKKIEVLSGGTPKTDKAEYWGGDIPWYSVKDAPTDSDVWVIATEKNVTELGVANSPAQVFPERTTIISARGTVGKLALTGVPMAMNQSCYGVRGRDGYTDLFTYYLLRTATVRLQQHTHGTVFDTITRQTFETLDCLFPPVSLATAFDQRAMPFLARIRANLEQSRTLAALRNALLPKLLSGELSTQDIPIPS